MSDLPAAAETKPSTAPARSKETKTITITVPSRIHEALQKAADLRGLGEEVPELVKNGLFLAYSSKEGWLLQLPQIIATPIPGQQELPLAV